ncbi:MAG TPA: hypothetical protein VK217_01405, partial [Acidimicrobiales bacterium]|nr:hypothetical protein [Acidimicrobiales bacterium]
MSGVVTPIVVGCFSYCATSACAAATCVLLAAVVLVELAGAAVVVVVVLVELLQAARPSDRLNTPALPRKIRPR